MTLMKKPGPLLEWHGNQIRVVVQVPPSARKRVGKTKLREVLPTSDPKVARRLAIPIIARFKGIIAGLPETGGRSADEVAKEALVWRREYAAEAEANAGESFPDLVVGGLVEQRHDELSRDLGEDAAHLFVEVATGRATPLTILMDAWLKEADYAGRTVAAFRHAVGRLEEWCRTNSVPATVEAITRKRAGQFLATTFIATGAHPATANKAITGLKAYWAWMVKRGHIEWGADANPWQGQRLDDKGRAKRRAARDVGETTKRPFTDDEVAKLLGSISEQPLADFIRVAALTGMRRDEIATLQVRHIRDGTIHVPGTKTAAAVRVVPLHSDLMAVISRRVEAKGPSAYLFHELPDQTSEVRGRGAPVTQAFTRRRREIGVDDAQEGVRQSRIDLHSFRRWFIRQAVGALERGATGFTPWTIADVVGHSKEEGTLGLTMGRYPGAASIEALKACVAAAKLPAAVRVQVEPRRRGRPRSL